MVKVEDISFAPSTTVHLVDLSLFYATEGGGVHTYLAAKSAWLRRHTSVQHTIVAPEVQEAGAQNLGTNNATTERTGDPAKLVVVPAWSMHHPNGYRLPRSIRSTARTLEQLQPDLIEVGDPYCFAWAARRAQKVLHCPLVAFHHSDLHQIVSRRWGPLAAHAARAYLRSLYRGFDLVLAPSRHITHQLRNMGIHQTRYQPLGVDCSIFNPHSRHPDLRRRLGLPHSARLLVYAGRFAAEKRLPLLLEAIERLGQPYHLLLVGGRQSTSYARVHSLPYVRCSRSLASLLASCDALVHPGDQETFGLVVLEAMACGLPVIGVAAGGVQELVDAGTGLLVRPASADALAEGIAAIYTLDRARLAMQAREKVLRQYDWQIIFPQLLESYMRLLTGELTQGAALSLATE